MKKKILKWLGGVPEAPNDGCVYARCGREWVRLSTQQGLEPVDESEMKERVQNALKY